MAQTQKFQGTGRAVVPREDHVAYIYHRTPVVRVFHDGRIQLVNNGWYSATTKLAMNQVSNELGLGYKVSQKNGNWIVNYRGENIPFSDHMYLP
jgi:hypothetical protein